MPGKIYCDSRVAGPGTGTKEDPWPDMVQAEIAIEGDPTGPWELNIYGVFRRRFTPTGDIENLTLQAWPGRGEVRPQIRGDVLVEGPWTAVGDGSYNGTLAGMNAETVTWNWDQNIDASGHRHWGHMELGSFDSLAPGEWARSGNTYQIRLPATAPGGGDTDPGLLLGDITACRLNPSGISMICLGNVHIIGIDVMLWMGDSEYGIHILGDTVFGAHNCTIVDCRAYDCGFHSIGMSGDMDDNCHMIDCLVSGLRQQSGTNYVMFSSWSSDPVNLTFKRCTIYLGGCYTDDMTTGLVGGLSTGGDGGGFLFHTSGSTRHVDLTHIHCKVYGHPVNATGQAYGLGGETSVPSDLDDPLTYPVKYFDCQAFDVAQAVAHGNGIAYAAFIRCFFNGTAELSTGDATFIYGLVSTDWMIFESCVIRYTSVTSGTYQIFRPSGGHLRLINCSIYMSSANTAHPMFRMINNPTIRCRGTVFVKEGTDRILTTGTMTVAQCDFEDCWYQGILSTTNGYSNVSSPVAFNTLATWTTEIDPDGVYDTDPEWIDNDSMVPLPGGNLTTTKKTLTDTPFGFNRLLYDDSYGAYQYAIAHDQKPLATMAGLASEQGYF